MNCPNCRAEVNTPVEMAAHSCPTDETQLGASIAAADRLAKLAERQAHQPTPTNLQADCVKVVDQLANFWDNEVESIVIMVPKDNGNARWATSVKNRDRLRGLLEATLKSIRDKDLLNIRSKA